MTRLLQVLDGAIRSLVAAGAAVATAVLLLLAVLGAIDVLATSMLNLPVPSAREVSSEALALLIFGAFAYAQFRNEHVAVDLFYARFPARLQHVVRTLGVAIGLALFTIFTIRMGDAALESYRLSETAAALFAFPLWPFKSGAALGASIAMLEYLRQLAHLVVGLDPLGRRGSSAESSL